MDTLKDVNWFEVSVGIIIGAAIVAAAPDMYRNLHRNLCYKQKPAATQQQSTPEKVIVDGELDKIQKLLHVFHQGFMSGSCQEDVNVKYYPCKGKGEIEIVEGTVQSENRKYIRAATYYLQYVEDYKCKCLYPNVWSHLLRAYFKNFKPGYMQTKVQDLGIPFDELDSMLRLNKKITKGALLGSSIKLEETTGKLKITNPSSNPNITANPCFESIEISAVDDGTIISCIFNITSTQESINFVRDI